MTALRRSAPQPRQRPDRRLRLPLSSPRSLDPHHLHLSTPSIVSRPSTVTRTPARYTHGGDRPARQTSETRYTPPLRRATDPSAPASWPPQPTAETHHRLISIVGRRWRAAHSPLASALPAGVEGAARRAGCTVAPKSDVVQWRRGLLRALFHEGGQSVTALEARRSAAAAAAGPCDLKWAVRGKWCVGVGVAAPLPVVARAARVEPAALWPLAASPPAVSPPAVSLLAPSQWQSLVKAAGAGDWMDADSGWRGRGRPRRRHRQMSE